MTCTITLVDGPEEGKVRITLEFDPPIGDGQKTTPASNLAMALLEAAVKEDES